MTDLHDPDHLPRVSAQVRMPDFDALRARGAARARRRRALTASAVAGAAAVTIAVAAWQVGRPAAEEPAPAPATSSPSPSVRDSGPAGLPDAVAVDPKDPLRRAVLRNCTRTCQGKGAVVTLTHDGFVTQREVTFRRPQVRLEPLGTGSFAVVNNNDEVRLIGPDDARALIDRAQARHPLAAGDSVLWVISEAVLALDPVAWRQYLIEMPDESTVFHAQAGPGSRLQAETSSGLWWSDDGTAWSRAVLPGADPNTQRPALVPSQRGSHHWVVALGEGAGATVRAVWDSSDGSTWQRHTLDEPVRAADRAVRGDDLVLAVQDEPGESGGRTGLYRVVGSSIEPWGDPVPGGYHRTMRLSDVGPVIVAARDGTVWMSETGRAWQPLQIRVPD